MPEHDSPTFFDPDPGDETPSLSGRQPLFLGKRVRASGELQPKAHPPQVQPPPPVQPRKSESIERAASGFRRFSTPRVETPPPVAPPPRPEPPKLELKRAEPPPRSDFFEPARDSGTFQRPTGLLPGEKLTSAEQPALRGSFERPPAPAELVPETMQRSFYRSQEDAVEAVEEPVFAHTESAEELEAEHDQQVSQVYQTAVEHAHPTRAGRERALQLLSGVLAVILVALLLGPRPKHHSPLAEAPSPEMTSTDIALTQLEPSPRPSFTPSAPAPVAVIPSASPKPQVVAPRPKSAAKKPVAVQLVGVKMAPKPKAAPPTVSTADTMQLISPTPDGPPIASKPPGLLEPAGLPVPPTDGVLCKVLTIPRGVSVTASLSNGKQTLRRSGSSLLAFHPDSLGSYTLTVAAKGYKTVRRPITLTGENTAIIVLEPGRSAPSGAAVPSRAPAHTLPPIHRESPTHPATPVRHASPAPASGQYEIPAPTL